MIIGNKNNQFLSETNGDYVRVLHEVPQELGRGWEGQRKGNLGKTILVQIGFTLL